MNHPAVSFLARSLRQVIGNRLKLSGLGEIWRDDRTWLELARELAEALAAVHVVIVGKADYERIASEAAQMRVVRGYVEDYQRHLSKEKRVERIRNPYARWAAENMSPKEGT
jgi:hypothetical protein